LTTDLAAGEVAGVALDTFASSLVGVDADGHGLTTCYTYADSRCATEVAALRRELDEPASRSGPAAGFTPATWFGGCDGSEPATPPPSLRFGTGSPSGSTSSGSFSG
jgi:hypothetical protein